MGSKKFKKLLDEINNHQSDTVILAREALKDVLHRETIPIEYVHRAESRRLAKEEQADEIWSG